jgi:uncharacterized protein YcfL
MNMKVKLVLAGLMLVTCSAFAQQKLNQQRDKIKSEKKEFINQYCGFTPAESEKLWKLNDEMESKLQSLKKTMRSEMKAIKDKGIDNASDSEIKKAMESVKNSELKTVEVKWEYNSKYIDAIGVKKTAKFYDAEREFRKKLLNRLKDMKGGAPEDID